MSNFFLIYMFTFHIKYVSVCKMALVLQNRAYNMKTKLIKCA